MGTRTLLILALVASVAFARYGSSRSKCLCHRTRDRFGPPRAILDIQIYPPAPYCDKMEIVVSLRNGVQYCLDPRVRKVQEMVQKMQMINSGPTASPEDGSTDIWAAV
ncbi:hypothetical protein SKAU_G00365270 [Synaphobranchus kaupii]|uniref:Chemokine interleukin-8-like domain-containing protein n=1 Tax=Synaphobranchus kaupii TaxID=118154 RepID=A0A9Q1IFF4_SYNKA|nr:hypothetical protein SKAU_G00365270 [Synaphobranchus kaupii]